MSAQLSAEDVDAVADKVAEKIKAPAANPNYQVLGFSLVGTELKCTVKTPSGEVYQGTCGSWERVKVVEVPK